MKQGLAPPFVEANTYLLAVPLFHAASPLTLVCVLAARGWDIDCGTVAVFIGQDIRLLPAWALGQL